MIKPIITKITRGTVKKLTNDTPAKKISKLEYFLRFHNFDVYSLRRVDVRIHKIVGVRFLFLDKLIRYLSLIQLKYQ